MQDLVRAIKMFISSFLLISHLYHANIQANTKSVCARIWFKNSGAVLIL